MPVDQKVPSSKALNGRDAVEFIDLDPEKPMSQDNQDFTNGADIYTRRTHNRFPIVQETPELYYLPYGF
jgi:hypothetical protein